MNNVFIYLELNNVFICNVQFGAYLYALTYVGGWMNGLTIIVLLVIGMFSLPKAYEVNKTQVDQYLGMAQEQVKMVVDK